MTLSPNMMLGDQVPEFQSKTEFQTSVTSRGAGRRAPHSDSISYCTRRAPCSQELCLEPSATRRMSRRRRRPTTLEVAPDLLTWSSKLRPEQLTVFLSHFLVAVSVFILRALCRSGVGRGEGHCFTIRSALVIHTPPLKCTSPPSAAPAACGARCNTL